MKNASVIRIKRLRRIARARMFLRKNGAYVLAGLCFALIAGAVLLMSGGRETENAPAEQSMDESLKEAAQTAGVFTITPRPVRHTPMPTFPPVTAEPTLMPEMTAHATAEPRETKPVFEPPVNGRLIRGYAMDCLIWSKTLSQWMTHPGVDIAAEQGSKVHAVAAGTVERVYTDDLMGRTVVILHEGGLRTIYMGLDEQIPVAEGDRVAARAVIGRVGMTAISECAEEPHLHFGMTVDGAPVDPSDKIVFKKEAQ